MGVHGTGSATDGGCTVSRASRLENFSAIHRPRQRRKSVWNVWGTDVAKMFWFFLYETKWLHKHKWG